MADGSCRDEEERVGVRTFKLVNNLRSELVANLARRIYSTHEAERGIDQLADHAGGRELAHSCEREDAVDVALGVARRITEVPHAQLVRHCVNRDAAIRSVLAMEARLVAIHDSARAEHRNSALGHRFGERRERREIVFDPSVRGEIAVKIARAWNVCDRHVDDDHSLRWRGRIRQTMRRFHVWCMAEANIPKAATFSSVKYSLWERRLLFSSLRSFADFTQVLNRCLSNMRVKDAAGTNGRVKYVHL